MHQDQHIVQTLLHVIEQLSTEKSIVIDDTNKNYISSSKVLDIGSEITIPKSITNESLSKYQTTNRTSYQDMSELCDVLIHYLRLRKDYPINRTSREDEFKFPQCGTDYSLQFSDFFIVEQAYMLVNYYLEYQEEYGYEYDGLINLSAKVALYLFEQMLKRRNYEYQRIGYDMEQHPSGFYYFPPNTNVMNYIALEIGRTDGFTTYDDDDDDLGEPF